MRQRIEDLGRIYAILTLILEDDLFELPPKYGDSFSYWFKQLSNREQEDILISIGEGIERVHKVFSECYEIAEGEDYLNRDQKDAMVRY